MGSFVSKEEEIKSSAKARLQELADTLSEHSLQRTIERFNNDLNVLKNTKVDIAITGVSGAGKSSLVNALRGMTADEEGAAETGVMETTRDLKGYPHPLFPNVTFWDLPGIGTPRFKATEYTRKFNFIKYDLFIIVSSQRFTENDVRLAHEIKKMNKKFYYVRTRVDDSIDSERRRQNFTEQNTLEKIICDNLTEAGESNPRVFLTTKWDLSMYDFPLLYQTLENDLDVFKRHALIESMPGFSREILKKKEAAMDALIGKVAFLSSFKVALPIPGLSLVCDLVVLEDTLIYICRVFGFDEFSLHRLAHWAGMPFDELRSAIKSFPLVSQITTEFVADLVKKSFLHGQQIADSDFYFRSVFKYLGFGGLSIGTLFGMLKSFLNDVVKDAENVHAKAAENFQLNSSKLPRDPSREQIQTNSI